MKKALAVVILAAAFGSSVSQASAQGCRIRLDDSLNKFSSLIEARAVAPAAGEAEAYEITDKLFTPKASTVRAAYADAAGPMVTELGVPHMTRVELSRTYSLDKSLGAPGSANEFSDGSLTWTLQPGSECTPFEISLIQFMVMEWLYFG